jgi:RNA polymerase-binding transcription factor DksA
MRKCHYRNCDKDISHKRKDALYCSRLCKSCESKYKRRKKAQIEKWKEKDMILVKWIKIIEGTDKN